MSLPPRFRSLDSCLAALSTWIERPLVDFYLAKVES
jgi:hypothetical protein